MFKTTCNVRYDRNNKRIWIQQNMHAVKHLPFGNQIKEIHSNVSITSRAKILSGCIWVMWSFLAYELWNIFRKHIVLQLIFSTFVQWCSQTTFHGGAGPSSMEVVYGFSLFGCPVKEQLGVGVSGDPDLISTLSFTTVDVKYLQTVWKRTIGPCNLARFSDVL